MNDGALRQLDAFTTPGTLLRTAREEQGMTAREAADRLNLVPEYVSLLETDNYEGLRSPAFARGYVRSYGRLLGLEEGDLLRLFDESRGQGEGLTPRRIETRPLQLQRTGLGVFIGLAVLLLLVLALWWWQESPQEQAAIGAGQDFQRAAGGIVPAAARGEL